MGKVMNRIILPAMGMALWITICIPICRKPEEMDWFFLWILAGFPFGIRRMFIWMVPKGYGIAGSMGVLAVNVVMGGLIGGVVLLAKAIEILVNCVKLVTGKL